MSAHIIIRAAGERTLSAAFLIARSEGLGVEIVSDVPFERTLSITYERGIAAGTKWIVTLDADVLLRPGAINDLLEAAEKMPPHFFELHAVIFDKITGVYRSAGHRVYRSSLLPQAIELIPPIGEQIRPESFVVNAMSRRGYTNRYANIIVGVHDYEQNFVDLYAKSFTHARKHPEIISAIADLARRSIKDDMDYSIIMEGLLDGLRKRDTISIDRRIFKVWASDAISRLFLVEKMALGEELPPVDRWLSEIGMTKPSFTHRDNDRRRIGRWVTMLREAVQNFGARGGLQHFTGEALVALGKKLRRGSA